MPTQSITTAIRAIPDWPEPGILFRDITPVLQDKETFRLLIKTLANRYRGQRLDYVAGIDARGFILGGALAYELNIGFIPVRKKGKLPYTTLSEAYELEYGKAEIEIHVDACHPGQKVLLIDDLVATGGTMRAAARLLRRIGSEVVETAAIVDLPDLGGSSLIRADGLAFYALCDFSGH